MTPRTTDRSGRSAASNVMAAPFSPPIPLEAEDTLVELKDTLPKIWSEIYQIQSKYVQSHQDQTLLAHLKCRASDAEDAIADCELQVGPSSTADGFNWRSMNLQMKTILHRYKQDKCLVQSLKLSDGDGKVRDSHHGFSRQARGPIPDKHRTVDDMHEKTPEIIECITKDFKQIAIVPVLGPPGNDKTTVAKDVYRNSKVESHFKLRAWVFVKESFDELELVKAACECIVGSRSNSSKLNVVQEELARVLDGKRFLIVLDNVWNKKNSLWESLWRPLASVEEGGVVMILTQDYNVYTAMQNNQPPPSIVFEDPFVLKPLNKDRPTESAMIDQVHLKKRRLLPEFPHAETLPDLRSSYRALSAPLKRCITYCSLFPDYHKFNKLQLIRFWIAEGFIHPEDGTRTLEDIGLEYFNELLNQLFFLYLQKYDKYEIPFPLHDILAYTSKNSEHLRIMGGNNATRESSYVRHASYVVHDHNNEIKWELLANAKGLRTFIVISNKDNQTRIDISFLPSMKYLRTLYLYGMDITEFPDSLGDLKHLRFLGLCNTGVRLLPNSMSQLHNLQTLDLSYSKLEEVPEYIGKLEWLCFLGLNGTAIRTLPDSIGKLGHLETLELMECLELEELPKDMRNMTSLRHLRVDNDDYFCMPANLEALVKLQTLRRFNVCRADGYAGIKELKHLGEIRGELNISRLCNVDNVDDCIVANLESKQYIKKLTLAWSLPPPTPNMDEEEFNDNKDGLSSSDEFDDDLKEGEGESNRCRGTNLMPINNATESAQGAGKSITNLISSFMLEKDNNNTIHFMHQSMESTSEEVNSSLTNVPQDDDHKNQVFEKLRPHDNLEILVIESYDGTVFPEWIANDSFKVKTLLLEDCKGCLTLPALGVLPSLENLVINRMPVEGIGSEFCPESSFPKLEVLRFSELYELCSWTGVKENDFPKLTTFDCFNCPKLGLIPNFVSLKTLEVENCGALESLPILPNLETLRIVACDSLKELPNLPNLRDLKVSYCAALEILPDLPSLEEKLWLEDCDNLKCVGFLGKTSLERKDMIKCFSTFYVVNCPHLGFSAWKILENGVSKLTYVDDKGIIEETLSKN